MDRENEDSFEPKGKMERQTRELSIQTPIDKEISQLNTQKICNHQLQSQHFQQYQKIMSHLDYSDNQKIKHSLYANGVKMLSKKSINNQKYRISMIEKNAGSQVFRINVKLRHFQMQLQILQSKQPSPFHTKQIGRGFFGTVFSYQNFKQRNAIKCIEIDRSFSSSQKLVKNLSKVIYQYCIAKILSIALVGPKISRIFGFDLVIFKDCVQFGMQLCQNQSVQEFSQQQMLKKLSVMHFLNIVHRDIKPQNLLYSSQQRQWFFSDFGTSTNINQNVGSLVVLPFSGTFGYIPKQYQVYIHKPGPIDPYYCDIYALRKAANYIKTNYIKKETNLKHYVFKSVTKNIETQAFFNFCDFDNNQYVYQNLKQLQEQKQKMTIFHLVAQLKYTLCFGTAFQLDKLLKYNKVKKVIKRERRSFKQFVSVCNINTNLPRDNYVFPKLNNLQLQEFFLLLGTTSFQQRQQHQQSNLLDFTSLMSKGSECSFQLTLQQKIQSAKKYISEVFDPNNLHQEKSIEHYCNLYTDFLWLHLWSRFDTKIEMSDKFLQVLIKIGILKQNSGKAQVQNPLGILKMQSLYSCVTFVNQKFIQSGQQQALLNITMIRLIIFRQENVFKHNISILDAKHLFIQVNKKNSVNLQLLKAIPLLFNQSFFQVSELMRQFTIQNCQRTINKLKQEISQSSLQSKRLLNDSDLMIDRFSQLLQLMHKISLNNTVQIDQRADNLMNLSYLRNQDIQKGMKKDIVIIIYKIFYVLQLNQLLNAQEKISKYDYSFSHWNNQIFDAFKLQFLIKAQIAKSIPAQKLKSRQIKVYFKNYLRDERNILKCDQYFECIRYKYLIYQRILNQEAFKLPGLLKNLVSQQNLSHLQILKILNLGILSILAKIKDIYSIKQYMEQVIKQFDRIVFSIDFINACSSYPPPKKKSINIWITQLLVKRINILRPFSSTNLDQILQKISLWQKIGKNQTEMLLVNGLLQIQKSNYQKAIFCFEKFLRQTVVKGYFNVVYFILGVIFLEKQKQHTKAKYYFIEYCKIKVNGNSNSLLFNEKQSKCLLRWFAKWREKQIICYFYKQISKNLRNNPSKTALSNYKELNSIFLQNSNQLLKQQFVQQITDSMWSSSCQHQDLALVAYNILLAIKMQPHVQLKMFFKVASQLQECSYCVKRQIIPSLYKSIGLLVKQQRNKLWLLKKSARNLNKSKQITKFFNEKINRGRLKNFQIWKVLQSKIIKIFC